MTNLQKLTEAFPYHTVHHWPNSHGAERFEICTSTSLSKGTVFPRTYSSHGSTERYALIMIEVFGKDISYWTKALFNSEFSSWGHAYNLPGEMKMSDAIKLIKTKSNEKLFELLKLSVEVVSD
tara:strand:+ start:461 stop:829 length:369 start_codon:yes stop_codon:yes gene_type:complete